MAKGYNPGMSLDEMIAKQKAADAAKAKGAGAGSGKGDVGKGIGALIGMAANKKKIKGK